MDNTEHPVLTAANQFRNNLTEQIAFARAAKNLDLAEELWDFRNELDLWLLDNSDRLK